MIYLILIRLNKSQSIISFLHLIGSNKLEGSNKLDFLISWIIDGILDLNLFCFVGRQAQLKLNIIRLVQLYIRGRFQIRLKQFHMYLVIIAEWQTFDQQQFGHKTGRVLYFDHLVKGLSARFLGKKTSGLGVELLDRFVIDANRWIHAQANRELFQRTVRLQVGLVKLRNNIINTCVFYFDICK